MKDHPQNRIIYHFSLIYKIVYNIMINRTCILTYVTGLSSTVNVKCFPTNMFKMESAKRSYNIKLYKYIFGENSAGTWHNKIMQIPKTRCLGDNSFKQTYIESIYWTIQYIFVVRLIGLTLCLCTYLGYHCASIWVTIQYFQNVIYTIDQLFYLNWLIN